MPKMRWWYRFPTYSSIMKPDLRLSFLIAGVQKGGTTALHRYLGQHSEIFLTKPKELHFFDNEQIDWTSPPYGRLYHRFLRRPQPGQVTGEATPIYTYWRPAAARIKNYNAEIKLIIMLRDPVARAYSHWRMEYSRKKETLSFSQAIREGRKRVVDLAEIPGQHRIFSYVERGFYAEQLKRLLSHFPHDQILYVTTKELRDHHNKTLDRICEFLGTSRFKKYPDNTNSGSLRDRGIEGPSRSDVHYLRELFHDDLELTENLIGREIGLEELLNR